MKCPTIGCDNSLPTHSRRKYCKNCRSSMRYYEHLRPAERLKSTARYERGMFRVAHLSERKEDQLEAVSQKRRDKRAGKSKSAPRRTRIYQESRV